MKSTKTLADTNPERILVIQLRQIGDTLMSTPAIRALRKAYPAARIDILVEPGPAQALAGNPHLSNIILRHPKRGPLGSISTIDTVRKNKYDVVIDYLANPRAALITWLSGARITISFSGKRRSKYYKYTVAPDGQYSGEQKLSLLSALGIHDDNSRPVFVVSEKSGIEADAWIAARQLARGGYIVIDATHRRETRLWRKFGELADAVFKEHGARCVFIWGPGEEAYIDAILDRCEIKHIKGPRPSFDMLGAIVERSAGLIGTCSAPAHLAAALGVPSLQVIGSSRAANWLLPEPIHDSVELGLPCQPCGKNVCDKNKIECMESLDVETVLNKFRDIANKSAPALRDLLEKKR